MALKIAGFLFTGPNAIEDCIVRKNHAPAVFAIVAKEDPPWDPRFRLIDIGDTGAEGLVFADHPDREDWVRESLSRATVYLLPVTERQGGQSRRLEIIRDIAGRYAVPEAIISD